MGLVQTRCFHCLRPFSPEGEAFSAHQGFAAADISSAASLCPQCRDLLAPYWGPRCPLCGLPAMPATTACETSQPGQKASLCGRCITDPPPWTHAAFHGLYRESLRHMLLRLKFDGHLYLAPLLGSFLEQAAHCLPAPDALVAVPQYPTHLRQRGYNQAHELAKSLHAQTGFALRPDLLCRFRPGPAQIGLSARSRPENVRHSFASSPHVRGLRVWLVDDVMTTGSTLRSAGLALLKAGAKRVDVLVVARTPREDAWYAGDHTMTYANGQESPRSAT
ncbi:MAG: ComF family protein [Desulfovibrio sp.]|nr:ComF family protein [Desulfovibrio sp.]